MSLSVERKGYNKLSEQVQLDGDRSLPRRRAETERRLTRGPDDQAPDWSPDGRNVVFVRAAGDRGLWVVDVETGAESKLLDAAGDVLSSPRWSPGGESVAFLRSRNGGKEDLWLVDTDGSHAREVAALHNASGSVTWSPEGHRLAYQGWMRNGPALYAVELEGLESRKIDQDGEAPVWTHDDRRIAYFDQQYGEENLLKLTLRSLEEETKYPVPGVPKLYYLWLLRLGELQVG